MPPEVMQRAEMLSGLSPSLVDVLPGRTVSGEDHSEVLGVLCFFDQWFLDAGDLNRRHLSQLSVRVRVT